MDDGADEGGPVGIGEGLRGTEDGDAALLLPVAPAIAAAGRGERGGAGAEVLGLLVQGGLVVLELYDQVASGRAGGFECALWQCKASSVTSCPVRPSSASSAWAAGISLDFSSMSRCASTSAVSVANTPSSWAAARSRNPSKLPRRVLPSIARLPLPGLAQAACSRLAATEGGLHRAAFQALQDVADRSVRRGAPPGQPEHLVQPMAVHIDEGGDAAIRVAAADDGQDREQQHIRQPVDLAFCPAVIRHLLQQAQQRRERGHGNLHLGCRPMSQTSAGPGIWRVLEVR